MNGSGEPTVCGSSVVAVITTIQPPTAPVRELVGRLASHGGQLIVIGDKKGPSSYPLEGTEFMSLAQQLESASSLARLMPVGHYARKNVGYLRAIQRRAACIYETDDDNAPAAQWTARGRGVRAARIVERDDGRWVNVYKYFTNANIWPRGLPLDEIQRRVPPTRAAVELDAPIQQGLVNRAPDVDAIWRLVFGEEFFFEPGDPVALREGNWCPFNTQNTWWWPEAYPLLYVPSHCSFRMCDIWKSFIAQRCLWAVGKGVVFFAADAIQDRNAHALVRDFADEVSGYTGNRRIAELLAKVPLVPDGAMGENLRACYGALVEAGVFPAKELELVDAWLGDLRALGR